MQPVLNESIFNNERALWENDIERTSVRSADLRLAEEIVYKTEGITPRGNRTIEGVLRDTPMSSSIKILFTAQFFFSY